MAVSLSRLLDISHKVLLVIRYFLRSNEKSYFHLLRQAAQILLQISHRVEPSALWATGSHSVFEVVCSSRPRSLFPMPMFCLPGSCVPIGSPSRPPRLVSGARLPLLCIILYWIVLTFAMNAYIGLAPAYATPHLCGPGEANICTGAALFSARGGEMCGWGWQAVSGRRMRGEGGGIFFLFGSWEGVPPVDFLNAGSICLPRPQPLNQFRLKPELMGGEPFPVSRSGGQHVQKLTLQYFPYIMQL